MEERREGGEGDEDEGVERDGGGGFRQDQSLARTVDLVDRRAQST